MILDHPSKMSSLEIVRSTLVSILTKTSDPHISDALNKIISGFPVTSSSVEISQEIPRDPVEIPKETLKEISQEIPQDSDTGPGAGPGAGPVETLEEILVDKIVPTTESSEADDFVKIDKPVEELTKNNSESDSDDSDGSDSDSEFDDTCKAILSKTSEETPVKTPEEIPSKISEKIGELRQKIKEFVDESDRQYALFEDHSSGKISDGEFRKKISDEFESQIDIPSFVHIISNADRFTSKQWTFYTQFANWTIRDLICYISRDPDASPLVYRTIFENSPETGFFYMDSITAFGFENKTYFREVMPFSKSSDSSFIYDMTIQLLGYEGVLICLRNKKDFNLTDYFTKSVEFISINDFSNYIDLCLSHHAINNTEFHKMITYLAIKDRIDELEIFINKIHNKKWVNADLLRVISYNSIAHKLVERM